MCGVAFSHPCKPPPAHYSGFERSAVGGASLFVATLPDAGADDAIYCSSQKEDISETPCCSVLIRKGGSPCGQVC